MELDREMEEAAQSLGAGGVHRLPQDHPARPASRAIAPGARSRSRRALGEFGSVVLISGNLPFKTEVASVFIFGQIENDNTQGAAAVSVVLLLRQLRCCCSASAGSARGRIVMHADAGRRTGPAALRARSRSATSRCCSRSRSAWSSTARSPTGSRAAWASITTPDAQHAFWLTIVMRRHRGAAEHDLRDRRRAGCSSAGAGGARRSLDAIIDLPFAVSPVVVGLALILVYGRHGWFGEWLTDARHPGDLLRSRA